MLLLVVVLHAFWLRFLPLLPLLAWVLEVDPSTSSIWVFLGLRIPIACFVMGSANYFSSAFGLFCLRPIHHCHLTFIFTFLLWCLVLPIWSDMIEHQETRLNFGGFCLEIGKKLRKVFSLGANTCYIFIFGPKSFGAHVPFGFFFCLTLPQWLKWSLVLRCVGEYACVTLTF